VKLICAPVPSDVEPLLPDGGVDGVVFVPLPEELDEPDPDELEPDELEELEPEALEPDEPEELEPAVLELDEPESDELLEPDELLLPDELEPDALELEDPLLCPPELLDPLVDVPELLLDCPVLPVDFFEVPPDESELAVEVLEPPLDELEVVVELLELSPEELDVTVGGLETVVDCPVFPLDRDVLPVPELLAGAPLPSVRVSSHPIWESTVMLSLRVPALITRSLTADVLNVALTPSQLATMDLPLFARATLMVLAWPAVPVTVRTPPIRLGVTLSMTRDSSISSPWKCLMGLTDRGWRLLSGTLTLLEIRFNKEARNLPVRFARAITSPFAREKTMGKREHPGQPDPIPETTYAPK
jgi:hypothetical protein